MPVKCIYYLEKGDMDGVYYVLGYSAPGMHATIQLYHGEKPTYFQVGEAEPYNWVCCVALPCCVFDLACFFLPSFSSLM